jgi:hypothetical protein
VALFRCGGDRLRLAGSRDSLVLMLRAIREGHRVLQALGVPTTPGNQRIFGWLPKPILVARMRRMVADEATSVEVGHAEAGRDEWRAIADELRDLTSEAGVLTPASDRLGRHLEPTNGPSPNQEIVSAPPGEDRKTGGLTAPRWDKRRSQR